MGRLNWLSFGFKSWGSFGLRLEVDFNRAFGFGEVLPQGCFGAFCGFFVPMPIAGFLVDLFRVVWLLMGFVWLLMGTGWIGRWIEV